MTLATVAQASVSVLVSATCGRTPNALLHLWGRCRRQVLQFCKFRPVCLDGGFWPAQEQLLCWEHSETPGRDRGCLDRRLSTQTLCNFSRWASMRFRAFPTQFTVLSATNIVQSLGTN